MTACCVCNIPLSRPEANWGTLEHPICEGCSKGLMPPPFPVGNYRFNMIEKRRTIPNIERAYFAQFSGDVLKRYHCDNCGAIFLAESAPHDPSGRTVCCVHCVFNPLGCRCKHGEFGVAETQDWGDYDDYEYDDEEEYYS